jgi:RHS repeat-associated protein
MNIHHILYIYIGRLVIASLLFISFAGSAQIVTLSSPTSGNYSSNQKIILAPGFRTTGPFRAYITGVLNVPLASNPSANQNYVRVKTYKVPSLTEIADPSVNQQSEIIQYFDGLGRPSQVIQTRASALGNDIVQPVAYDAWDREVVKYLPFADQNGNGAFKSNVISTQNTFYSNSGWDTASVRTPAPYSQTIFEASPLNRVLEQGAPGTIWQPAGSRTNSGGRTVVYSYGTNNGSISNLGSTGYGVRLYNAKPVSGASYKSNLVTEENYAAGALTLKITKNENWISSDGKAGTIEEYFDRADQLILKRTFNTDLSVISAYYVYDDAGNLSFVLTPGANPDAGSFSQNTLDDFCYQYRYDGKNRLIEKKLPGKGWDYIVYNNRDEPVYTQDSVQRNAGIWLFKKYDVHGRQVITGIYSSNSTRLALESILAGETTYYESPQGSGIGYTSNAAPQSFSSYLTANYYDVYTYPGASTYPFTASSKSIGLLTGSREYVLGTADGLLSVNYYDEDGRIAKVYKQHYQAGSINNANYDEISTTYNFEGAFTALNRIHHSTTSGNTTIITEYEYDHVGRKLRTYEQININSRVLLAENHYNEVGQLKDKTQGDGKQLSKFGYNERGWMKWKHAPLYSMSLKYADGSFPRYNGDISNQIWSIPGSTGNNFSYQYDALSRLLSGDTGNGIYEKDLSYDVMGNILNLNRSVSGTQSYSYSGNKLSSVSGGATRSYTYDGNGNAVSDGTNNYSYNLLNLPSSISGGVSMNYTYDALGRKLKRVAGGSTTDYVDGIQYSGGQIDFIQTEEGLARKSGSNYIYEYNLTDHLGKNRVSFDVFYNAAREIQHDNYYPFGKTYGSYVIGSRNNYLYNSKELQDGIGQYDYGARFYDPVIGRFTTVDPLAETSRRH